MTKRPINGEDDEHLGALFESVGYGKTWIRREFDNIQTARDYIKWLNKQKGIKITNYYVDIGFGKDNPYWVLHYRGTIETK